MHKPTLQTNRMLSYRTQILTATQLSSVERTNIGLRFSNFTHTYTLHDAVGRALNISHVTGVEMGYFRTTALEADQPRLFMYRITPCTRCIRKVDVDLNGFADRSRQSGPCSRRLRLAIVWPCTAKTLGRGPGRTVAARRDRGLRGPLAENGQRNREGHGQSCINSTNSARIGRYR